MATGEEDVANNEDDVATDEEEVAGDEEDVATYEEAIDEDAVVSLVVWSLSVGLGPAG